MISAVDGLLLGQMRKHLDTKAAVQVVRNPFFPRTPYDLRGEATRDAGLGHDVGGNLPGAIQENIPGDDFIDHSILKGLFGVNRLACEQSVGSALDTQQFQKTAMNTISRNGADVIVK